VTWPPPDWRVVVCDVGQGDGIVLASGAGRAVVVDTGPDAGAVSPCLRRLDVAHVDAVVLTHFDADHISGLADLLDRWPVTEILVSVVAEPTEGAAEVSRLAADHRIPVRVLRAGDRLVWEEVTAMVWWPARPVHSGSLSNNASVVLAVESGLAPASGEPDRRVRALLLGDIEREAGRAILTRLRREPVWTDVADRLDLVKTPHHGSPNIDERLVRALPAPRAAVSVGADNDYGHPAPSHLDLYRSVGSVVVRTDEAGDIALLSRGPEGEVRWRTSRGD
jgi:competence protein ComEC